MMWEWSVFLATTGAVTVGCLLPARWLPPLPNDKLMHFLAYAALTVLAARIAPRWGQQQYWLGGLLVGGWLIEVAQNRVPGRAFSWPDLAANAAGIATAAAGAAMLHYSS